MVSFAATRAGGTCYTQYYSSIKNTQFMKELTLRDTDFLGRRIAFCPINLWHKTPTDGFVMPKGDLLLFTQI